MRWKWTFYFHLVSFATVTQQSQHLINLILSDGFRELQCPVCSAPSLYDSMVVGNLFRGMRGVTGDPFFCYWVDLWNLWLWNWMRRSEWDENTGGRKAKLGWAYIRGRAGSNSEHRGKTVQLSLKQKQTCLSELVCLHISHRTDDR